MKKINELIINIGNLVGKKAVNADCDYYLYNEPIPKNLKKYECTNISKKHR